ncbi:hypothetical protein J6358_27390 [Burkholderia pseudomallei]|uniref:hypothetical protein n=1 Tax=Burkholderia pseudomallei TaxID=28450 RepID=UPI001AD622E9|nr:hypothetical protein [Burkholderia pseudomallei]MBO7933461.1 hypothetical protein [Burkholderia pseudomallei]
MIDDAIGGYFSLELPDGGRELHPSALCFQSARAAFLALLRAHAPNAVWVPWYLCESMLESLHVSGTSIRRYALASDLSCPTIPLEDGEWLLYVNYFGVCERHVDDVLRRHPPDRVLIDNAHALFSAPRRCLATLYSPRKFVGVPDGGYLVTGMPVPLPEQTDNGSVSRCRHLLTRLEAGAEAGYASYVEAEVSLRLQEPRRMSPLTQRMLASIDYATVRARRAENFRFLHTHLCKINHVAIEVDSDCAPLCYPLIGAPQSMRDAWRAQRIYTATYWPDLRKAPGVPDFERGLPDAALFIPCDQRLSPERLMPLVNPILEQCHR